MPWNNQGGGWQGGGPRGPWSQGPSGGGSGGGGGGSRSPGPDLEELLKRGQDRFKRAMPGRLGSGGFGILALILLFFWIISGFYFVQPGEQGVETRFGAYKTAGGLTTEGLNYHWPYPIESKQVVNVSQLRTVNVGYDDGSAVGRPGALRDVPQESLMLTGDENIVDVDFSVQWTIKSAPDFLFNVLDPQDTIKAVAESAVREIVGRNRIDLLQTEERGQTQEAVKKLLQDTLDQYRSGVQIFQVQMQKVDPPQEVIAAFRDVQAARADQQRAINEAQAYRNKVVPEARGDAERIRQEAEAYKEQTVAQATGEAQRFLAIYNEYKNAKGVTRERIFLETMEKVLGGTQKVIIDKGAGSGVVPYLPLNELRSRPQSAPAAQGGSQ